MQDKSKVRWAILGAGKIAHKFAQDFTAIHGAELVAVAASDTNRAAAFAAQYGVPQAFTYNELYQSNLVDAVYIATTHNFHYEQSMACLQHGKAVLCEKPITINDTQFNTLATISKEKNVFLMEAMWTYFLPALQKAKQWLNEGRIGTVKAIQADFSFPMEYDPKGRMYNPSLAGGALLDLGIYPIALATYFLNQKPNSIKASACMTRTGVDETTSMIFQYDTVAAVLLTSLAIKTSNKASIFGDKGSIEIPDFFKATTALLYNSEHQLIETFEDGRNTNGYNYEMQQATDDILKGDIENKMMPHSRSRELQEIMTEVRKQIGLKYPMEP